MSEASWTPLSVVDRKAVKARREVVRATRLLHLAVAGGVAACLVPPALGGFYPVVSLLSFGVAVASLLAARCAFVWRKNADTEVWQRDAELIDEFRADRSWLVEILVLQGAAPTGKDRGMLWIEEERLYFAGERTSFGLTADQTLSGCRFTTSLPGLCHDLTLPLRGGASLSFSPVVAAKWQDRATLNEMAEAIDYWSWRGEAKGGQLPPLALGEDVPDEWALLLGALAARTFWTLVSLMALAMCFSLFGCFFVVPVVTAQIVQTRWKAVQQPGLRWRAWRDRRRLRRQR